MRRVTNLKLALVDFRQFYGDLTSHLRKNNRIINLVRFFLCTYWNFTDWWVKCDFCRLMNLLWHSNSWICGRPLPTADIARETLPGFPVEAGTLCRFASASKSRRETSRLLIKEKCQHLLQSMPWRRLIEEEKKNY
jgi:hypothetical protein